MSTIAASSATAATEAATRGRYLAPSKGQRFGNAFATGMARMGLKMGGLHELSVVGRTSGERRNVPVSPVDIDGVRYLVAPRGVTDWVLNVRAAGELQLRNGRRIVDYRATELLGDTTHILRAYLAEYHSTVKGFFDPITPESTDAEFAAIAGGYPVFRLDPMP